MHVVVAGIDRLVMDSHPDLRVATADDDPLVDLAVEVQDLLDDGPVLVLCPSWDPEMVQTLDSLHAALDDPRLLRHATSLPPLGAAALGGIAARLAAFVDNPAVLAAGMSHVESGIEIGAVVSSVARLEQVSTSLGNHVASWLPGGRFVVLPGAEEPVRRVRRKDVLTLPEVGHGRMAMVAGSEESELFESVKAALDAQGVTAEQPVPMPLSDRAATWWGTAHMVEFAFVVRDLAALADEVKAKHDSVQSCTWCGRRSPVGACRWCGHHPVEAKAIT